MRLFGTPHWSLECSSCGEKRGCYAQWEQPGVAMWDCDCGAALDFSAWVRSDPVFMPRLSGFSKSESDFKPHFNRAFGQPVRSLAEMKALQAKHGTSDVVAKGDGAEEHAPRDIGRRIRRYNDLRDAVNNGQTVFEPKMEDGRPSGVKIDLSTQTEAD